MPLDSSYDGYRIKYRHSDQSFVMVAPPAVGTPPTIVSGFTVYNAATNGTSRVINTPTHSIGDYIFVGYASDGNNDTASMAGFTALFSDVAIFSDQGVFCLFYKLAGGSEPATYTLTNTVSERCVMVAWAVRGMSNFHNTSGVYTSSAGTPYFPAMVTTVPNCLRMNITGTYKEAIPYGSIAGYTKMTEQYTVSGGSLAIYHKEILTPTTDPVVTTTQGTSATNWYVSVSVVVAP